MSKVIVIGAGITGITTAYSLVRRGHEVTVVDKEPYAAMKTSYANGGQLSASNSEVWTTWANIGKAATWIFKKDAPLLINPMPSTDKLSWMAKFFINTVFNRYQADTVATIKMALEARQLYYQIAEIEKINFDLTKNGILHFYKNSKYYQQALQACELYQANGVNRYAIDMDSMLAIEPALAKSKDIVGATFTPEDANGDIHKFCTELSKVLANRYRVEFMLNTTVESINKTFDVIAVSTTQGQTTKTLVADHVVICTGADSARIARMVNDKVDVYPVKGYSITIDLPNKAEQEAAPEVSLLDDEAKIVSSRLGNRFRVAGTAELAGYNYDIRKDRVDPLISWVRDNFPGVSTEHCIPWAGLRPMTPNMLPIVRSSAVKHVWFNTGHGHLGWTLSAATAELVADKIELDPNDNLRS